MVRSDWKRIEISGEYSLEDVGRLAMNLYGGELYWNKTAEPVAAFLPLEADLTTEVLIIGSGMSGSLCAHRLASQGRQVTVVEKIRIGTGSSAANTGMLQYSNDKMLSDFADEIGEEAAVLFYQMCLEGMDNLTKLNQKMINTEYRLRDSIYFASQPSDIQLLEREFYYLNKHAFPAEFLNHRQLKERYGIDKVCGIRTYHDADVNPYKMIQALTKENSMLGVDYYEWTSMDLESIQANSIHTYRGSTIWFDHLILTTGYGTLYPIIHDKAKIVRTYALCSKPLVGSLWTDEVMIWETQRPYLYFRSTVDHRIIAGGLDEEQATILTDQVIIKRKCHQIAKKIMDIYPYLDIQLEFAWNALFGTSLDGRPFIGRDPQQANRYYLLGFEGNGTCYSMAGSHIISDLIAGKTNPYTDLVRVDRSL